MADAELRQLAWKVFARLDTRRLDRLVIQLLRWNRRNLLLRLLTLPWIVSMIFRHAVLLLYVLYVTQQTYAHRWRSASRPPITPCVHMVHAVGPGGGFIEGWFSDGRWWTRDFSEEKAEYTKREIRVCEWREIEGSAAEPWHDRDRYWPLSFDQQPRRTPEPPQARPKMRRDQTHTERLFDRALEQGLFIKWPLEVRLGTDEIRTVIERYFAGIDVTIDRVERPYGGEQYVVTLEEFPERKDYWTDQDPATVKPHKQHIVVQINEDYVHAGGEMYGPAARGLAVGLNAHMIEAIEQKEREVALVRMATGKDG